MTIPADIRAADAAGRIPSNVSLTYLAQSQDDPALAGILFMVCFTGVLMILRLFARAFLVKKVGLDDWLAILTLVCPSINLVSSVLLFHDLKEPGNPHSDL